jgi:hypothetical protein
MNEKGLYQQYEQMKGSKVLVSLKGALSQDVITEFGTMIKSSLSAETNTRKIFAVFIELAQNILHYSAERSDNADDGVGIILLREVENLFYLSSGNLVVNDNGNKIHDKCEIVNSKTKEELKALYQQQIKDGRPEGSKGAGLGLIDIARKCDSPIDCIIDKIDDTNSFMTLTVSFKKDNQ